MNHIQPRIEVLRPVAGDTIAVHVDAAWLTREQVDQIQRRFAKVLPDGVKVAVLDSSLSLAHIVAPERTQPQPESIHFDTWMQQRTERAHAEFMERTSRRLPCDATPREVAAYMRGSRA